MTIRHQARGCHAWSLDVQLSGPKVGIRGATMNGRGATAQFLVGVNGVYRFRTLPGKDYPGAGRVRTVGRDNVLRLTVVVN